MRLSLRSPAFHARNMLPTPTARASTIIPMSLPSIPPTSIIRTIMRPMKRADELDPIITMNVVRRMGR